MSNLHLPVAAMIDTYGASTGTSLGTTVSNGSYTQITGSTTRDYDAIIVNAVLGSQTAEGTLDIGIGSSGSEFTIIDNLRIPKPGTSVPAVAGWHLPLTIPRGTRIAAQGHGIAPTVIIYGISYGPLKTASFKKAESIGISSNQGVGIDPGGTANTLSAYVQITGSTSHNYQAIGMAIGPDAQTSNGANTWLVDVAYGASGSEQLLLKQWLCASPNTSIFWREPNFVVVPCNIPLGTRLAARAQGSGITSGSRKIDVALYGFIR